MPGVAGQVKVIFSADTASYTASVKAAKQQLGVFEQSATSAGKVARQQFADARGGVMVLGEEIGVHLPRHVQAFIAKLPGVTSAMSSAFSAIAVIAIGKAVFEAGEKIYEFFKKAEDAAKKNAFEWDESKRKLAEMADEIELSNLKLEHKPGNQLAAAIIEARLETERLDDKLQAAIKDAQALLEKQAPGMMQQFFMGTASTGYEQTMLQEHARRANLALNPGEMLGESQSFGASLQARLSELLEKQAAQEKQSDQNVSASAYMPSTPGGAPMARPGFDYQAEIKAVSDLIDRQKEEARYVQGIIEQTKLKLQIPASGGAGAAAPGALDWGNYYPGYFKAAAAAAAPSRLPAGAWNWAAQYNAPQPATTPALAGLSAQQMEAMFPPAPSVTLAQKMPGPFDAFLKSLQDTAKEFTNLDQVLSSFTISTLNQFNETLIKVLSTPENMLRGKHPWRNLGASAAESAGSAALKFGEGEIMKSIPGLSKLFGGKPTGTASDPLWVRLAGVGGSMSPMSSIGSTAAGMVSAFGGGSMSPMASIGSGVASAVSSFGIPGFAEGGMIPSNMPAIVGENGPELFMPSTSGRIAPSGSFGGSPNIYIDAKGSNDPAAIHAAVHRAMASYLPHIGSMAISAMRDNNRRIPPSRARG
jgi:hypothetical protein